MDGRTARGKKRKNVCTGGVKLTLEPSLYDDPSTTQAALKEECNAHGVQHAGPTHGAKSAMGRALKAHYKEYHPDQAKKKNDGKTLASYFRMLDAENEANEGGSQII